MVSIVDEIITLIWPTESGEDEKTELIARIESVSQSEFFAAAQAGFKSQYKVLLWFSDYDEQPLVEIRRKRYSVYRSYLRSDQMMELYLTDKIGD